jgi:tetratricopeptide (TPR) repeat protein
MTGDDFIAQQQALLADHRRRLALRLRQQAMQGAAHVAPEVVFDIEEARSQIALIKARLRATSIVVDDHPSDNTGEARVITPSLTPHVPMSSPDVAPLPAGSRMPHARNPLFVGRADELKTLTHALLSHHTSVAAVAITGMGGVGKTNLATEFVHRYGHFFSNGVYWLSFADPAAVPAEVADCGRAHVMTLPGFDALTLDDQCAWVMREWRSSHRRLLIFDNCEDETLLARWYPSSGGSRVLITSRRSQWDLSLGVATVPLPILSRGESVALLQKFRPDLTDRSDELVDIAAELGDLPLALHLAGSFLAKYRHAVTPGAYLTQLRGTAHLQHSSLQANGISPTAHTLDVGRTFALSYERLDPIDPIDAIATALLIRAACFAPGEAIPRDLLRSTSRSAFSTLAATSNSDLQVEDAIARLLDLGLLDLEADGMLRMHRLLAAFVDPYTADAAILISVEQTMLETAKRLNNIGHSGALLALQPHLRSITDRALKRAATRSADLCNTLGYHLQMLGDYQSALPYFRQALATSLAVLGEHHPETATSFNNLGAVLDGIGDLTAARSYFERALAIRRDVLGAQHPDTAASLNNLGTLLQQQGNLIEARLYFDQALSMRRQLLGEHHQDTATSMDHLGYLLQAQGYLVEAWSYYAQALAIRREILGVRHPDTATSLNNLGVLLHDQGDLAKAREYCEQALAIRREVLGMRHPDTAVSLNNLGALLHDQGDLVKAQEYCEQALAIRREILGEQHPDTALSRWWFAIVLEQQGEWEAARDHLQCAVEIFTRVFGLDHAWTRGCQLHFLALDALEVERGLDALGLR